MSNERRNPLNVKNGEKKWRGSSASDAQGHAIFSDDAYGIRAGMRCLQQKFKAGKNTLNALLASWAPPDDGNDPEGYAAFIARKFWVWFQDGRGRASLVLGQLFIPESILFSCSE